jgi:hypothetical protein
MPSQRADRSADRHKRAPVTARLDEDDDRWFRAYCERQGMKIRQGVIAAVKAYRKQVENETTETPKEQKP